MSKPENSYIQKIHRKLPKEIYREKMANPYRGGTPDVYYESSKERLWVEYKYLESLPRTFRLTNEKGKTKISPLQAKWLRRAFHNGVNVMVIMGVGSKTGILFSVSELDTEFTREQLEARLRPNDLIAKTITGLVM